MASTIHCERRIFEMGFPFHCEPQATKSCSPCRKEAVLALYTVRALTGQRQFSLLSSAEEKGGGWKAVRSRGAQPEGKVLGRNERFGLSVTLVPFPLKRRQLTFTERACMSPARFAVVKATSRAVFNERNFRSTASSGSNGSFIKESSTIVKSQEGTSDLLTGLRRATPFMN